MSVIISSALYGKDKVRVFRIVREGTWHHVVEYNLTILLEGDLDLRYAHTCVCYLLRTIRITLFFFFRKQLHSCR